MDSDIAYASNILLPCAATKSDHAIRKAEFDAFTTNMETALAGLSSTEKKTVTATLSQFSEGSAKTITHNIDSFNYIVDIAMRNNSTSYTNSYVDGNDSRQYVSNCFEITKYKNTVNITCRNSDLLSCILYVIVREV